MSCLSLQDVAERLAKERLFIAVTHSRMFHIITRNYKQKEKKKKEYDLLLIK